MTLRLVVVVFWHLPPLIWEKYFWHDAKFPARRPYRSETRVNPEWPSKPRDPVRTLKTRPIPPTGTYETNTRPTGIYYSKKSTFSLHSLRSLREKAYAFSIRKYP
jgi:hypothetical protein